MGGGNFPPGRGMLWAIIQRRQMFCERIQSPPFQNCSTESGVRTSSSGSSLKCVNSWPARMSKPAIRVADEIGGPLARPADDDDQPLVLAPLQVEVRHVGVGRTSARRAEIRLVALPPSTVSSGV